jgi:hypothetical protein
MSEATQDIFSDADLIFSYTRKQAIEDGVLVELSSPVCREHYKYPIAGTAAVWAIIDRAVKNPRTFNSLDGVLHDILWMSRACKRTVDPTTVLFQVLINGAGRQKKFTFKMVCGPSDDGSPCLTLMLPEED